MAEHRTLVATWQVSCYPVDVYEYSSPIDEGDPDGMTDTSVRPREIRYHARLQGAERWQVLFHELTHLALKLMSIEAAVKPSHLEAVCDAVGLTCVEALRSYLAEPPTATNKTIPDSATQRKMRRSK